MTGARTLLVTGCSSGIGQAICSELLGRGHRVIGVARHPRRGALPPGAFVPVSLDLADLDQLPAALADLVRAYPQVSGVVACAGEGRFGGLETFSFAQIDRLLDLNLRSQIYLARAWLPVLRGHGHSDLLLMGSEAGLHGGRYGAVYSAAKAGLRGFAQALRAEGARSGVRVSLVNPGMVRSAFFDRLDFAPGDAQGNALLPEDVARAVWTILDAEPRVVFDEVNLSPLTRVVVRGRTGKPGDGQGVT